MPIDARIPLMVRPAGPIQQPDFQRIDQGISREKSAAQMRELRSLQIKKAEAEAATRPGMTKLSTRKAEAEASKAETSLSNEKLTLLGKQNDLVGDTAASVLRADSQAGWDWGRKRLADAGIDIGNTPALWGDKTREMTQLVYDQALGAKEHLNQYWKEQEQERKTTESTARTSEATRRDETTRRGQDLRTEVGRERNRTTRRGQDLKAQDDKVEVKPRDAIKEITRLQELARKIEQGKPVDANEALRQALQEISQEKRRQLGEDIETSQNPNATPAEIAAAKARSLETIRAAIDYYAGFAPKKFRQRLGFESTPPPEPSQPANDPKRAAIQQVAEELGIDPNTLQTGTPEYVAFIARVRALLGKP